MKTIVLIADVDGEHCVMEVKANLSGEPKDIAKRLVMRLVEGMEAELSEARRRV